MSTEKPWNCVGNVNRVEIWDD